MKKKIKYSKIIMSIKYLMMMRIYIIIHIHSTYYGGWLIINIIFDNEIVINDNYVNITFLFKKFIYIEHELNGQKWKNHLKQELKNSKTIEELILNKNKIINS